MQKLVRFFINSVGIVFCFSVLSCASYKQNIMFKPGEGFTPDPIKKEALAVEKNYTIQKNDYLKLDVFSNRGERLIDPNPELTNTTNQTSTTRTEFQYLVDINGIVKFPMIGELKVEGLTLREAEEITQKEFQKYFKDPYVIITYNNKRVVVLGAAGGQVIPLVNQNVTLVETIALAKGLSNDAKADNIRVLRNDKVFIIDLSTIEGFKAGNMLIEPGDIVYIEPIRRPLSEALRDYSGVLTMIVSLTTLLVLINSIK
jgi:polysaccharide export outer membrane protein